MVSIKNSLPFLTTYVHLFQRASFLYPTKKITKKYILDMAHRLRVSVVENRLDWPLVFSLVTDILNENDPRRIRLEQVVDDMSDPEFDDLAIHCYTLVRNTMVYLPEFNQGDGPLNTVVRNDRGQFTITQDVLAYQMFDVYLHITYIPF